MSEKTPDNNNQTLSFPEAKLDNKEPLFDTKIGLKS